MATGLVFFAGTLYWIAAVMETYGGLHPVAALVVNALLVGYLALFPGLFALAMAALVGAFGIAALGVAPAVWVTTELGRMYLLSGFPWELLGYSQTPWLPVAQVASLAGVHGLSALVALVNAGLAFAVVGRGRSAVAVAVAAVSCALVASAWGAWRVGSARLTSAGVPVRVALLQGNVAQEDKWEPSKRQEILRRYLDMTRAAAARGAELVVWPESSTPFVFEEDAAGSDAIRALARETGTHLLVGSDQIERGPVVRYYNAAFLVTPDGATAAVYRKMHLVPFGEYVPLRRLLFFASPLVESVGDFAPGVEPTILPVGSHAASTAICYEVIYPGLMRRFVEGGAELLTTITNDAWYGHSSAPYQHFQQAVLRAIEQGRYLVRAANTGVSGIVDPYGRVLARSPIFEPATIVGDARWLTGRTVYGRTGDVFAHACAVLTGAALLAAGRRPRRGA